MSINEQPLVTVYIPTFNRLELLQRAVESVRNQTYKNLEIIVVDDCSTDGTQKYLEQLAKEDSRVRYFLKEKNSGACVSRNIAIENAKGEFITGLDDDDYFIENRIQYFIENWNDDFKCLFTNLLFKRDDSRFKTNYRIAMKDIVVQKDLLKANHIGNQVFTKTLYLKEINGFDPNMEVWQDLECWYNLLNNNGVAKRIKKEMYVVDISHPHERISNKKVEKVKNSFEFFSKKHALNIDDQNNLKTHMINYGGVDLELSVYLRKFLNYKSLGNLKLLIKKKFNINH